jgi:hypothetical protein
MYLIRLATFLVTMLGSAAVFIIAAGQQGQYLSENDELKTWSITYRIEKDGKWGEPQTTTVIAKTSSEAKEQFRKGNPKAQIISCNEVKNASINRSEYCCDSLRNPLSGDPVPDSTDPDLGEQFTSQPLD